MKQAQGKLMYGRKVGMTHVFSEQGEFVPVTVLELPPNVVFQVKTVEKEGYKAIQIGFGNQKPQRINKPLTKHFAKAEKGFPKVVKEIRTDQFHAEREFKVGDELTVDGMFEVGSKVDVVGTSIGKGMQGVVKLHGMKGAQTMTHGTHEHFRHVGSIGCRKFPGRVFKNKRMPAHMGVDTIMLQNLEVVSVRPADNLLLVRGGVPGPVNGTVMVRTAVKGKK